MKLGELLKRLAELNAKHGPDMNIYLITELGGPQVEEPVVDTAVSQAQEKLILIGASFDERE